MRGLTRRLQLLVDLPRQDGGELVGKGFHACRQLAGIRGELVVGDNGRNSGEQTDGGRQQRFGNTGRNDGEVGGFEPAWPGSEVMIPETVPKGR